MKMLNRATLSSECFTGKDPCLNCSMRLLTGCALCGLWDRVPLFLVGWDCPQFLAVWASPQSRTQHGSGLPTRESKEVQETETLQAFGNPISEAISLLLGVSHCAQPMPKDMDSKSWDQRGLTTRSCKD